MRELVIILMGLASGMVISGAVFAFIAAIGIVTRMAQKSQTQSYIILYEEAIMAGGIAGTLTMAWSFVLPIGALAAVYSLLTGVFFGVLAMSLAEVLEVMPIIRRRLKLAGRHSGFVWAIALGKLLGSLLYFLIDGFSKS